MKKLTIGILAHVDAGKTTLSEALLYSAGALRSIGRVDHGDAFLDTERLERERGITIFSKEAMFMVGDTEFTLLDTPGHVDFSAEMERTLAVLDYAILIISGTDGVQSHTRTLWRLLEHYNVPTFLFINKTDLPGVNQTALIDELKAKLSSGCINFTACVSQEELALCGEAALEQFLENGSVSNDTVAELIDKRAVFPCFFGSALKLDGIDSFLAAAATYMREKKYADEFCAQVFKISRDGQGARLTHLKVTGGTLKTKMPLSYCAGGTLFKEKADQLRLYSGTKYKTIPEADAGSVVVITGLSHSYVGMGLGCAKDTAPPMLEPVLTYQLLLPNGEDPHSVLPKLRELEEEDPMIRIMWDERNSVIHVHLMGKIQLEILRSLIFERFGFAVDFGEGSIVYRETIQNETLGLGHFEPLRHYAEVQLLLSPLPRGSGIRFESKLSTDTLDLNWQRLIATHIFEREHCGVLTGSPMTDILFTLVAGRAHLKHTEGGDFRQATYRAIRQGLMQAKSILLEPYYDLRLEVPSECIGRAMTDLQNMGGTVDAPVTERENVVLTGYVPVASLQDYFTEVAAYTHGRGQLSCSVRGYDICHNQESVVASLAYDAERDTDNPPSSVFCDHGGSITIPWNEVSSHIHCDSGLCFDKPQEDIDDHPVSRGSFSGSFEQDKELQSIFERTYGKVERKAFEAPKKPARTSLDEEKYNIQTQHTDIEYLLVDGYNIIFAWDELKRLAEQDIDTARSLLIDILANYRAYRSCVVILVFDAYKVKGSIGSVDTIHGIKVVYTKEAETADSYIERATYELRKERRVRVATSDNLEQVIILGHGAMRVSAQSFRMEVEEIEGQISTAVERINLKNQTHRTIAHIGNIKQDDSRNQ